MAGLERLTERLAGVDGHSRTPAMSHNAGPEARIAGLIGCYGAKSLGRFVLVHPIIVPNMDNDENAVAKWLEVVRAIPPLRPVDEPDVLAAARRGGDDEASHAAGQRAIEGYFQVTTLLAMHLAPVGVDPMKAIEEAHLVLMRLVFDPTVPSPVVALTPALVRHYAEVKDLGWI